MFMGNHGAGMQFQSTLPAGGATRWKAPVETWSAYFNPRSPQGERQLTRPNGALWLNFNPRSPQGERLRCFLSPQERHDFNPRSPQGERHLVPPQILENIKISIHAPRRGSDTR